MKRLPIHSRKRPRYRKPAVLPEKFIAGGNTGSKWLIWLISSLAIHVIAFGAFFAQQINFPTAELSMEKGLQSVASAYFIPIQPPPPPKKKSPPVPAAPPPDILEVIASEEPAPIEVDIPEPEPEPIIEEENIEELPPVEMPEQPEQTPEKESIEEIDLDTVPQAEETVLEKPAPEAFEIPPSPTVIGNSADTFSLPSVDSYGAESESPHATVCPSPRYPPIAIRRGIEGSVILSVSIDATGKPTHATVIESSGYDYFDEEAIRTVLSRWQFQTTQAQSNFRLRIDFRLKK